MIMDTPGDRSMRQDGPTTFRSGPTPLSRAEAISPRMRRRRAITLVVLTLLAPGSAQLLAGNRRLGRFGLRVWLSLVVAAAVIGLFALVNRSFVFSMFSRSWVLLVVSVLLTGCALGWALLFADVLRLARLRSLPQSTRWVVAGSVTVLTLVTSGGLLWAGATVNSGRGFITQVFGSNAATGPTGGRYNVLLLGGDSGKGRDGTRPDSLTLVSVDADTGRTVMFGFARNTENIHFRSGSTMAKLMPEGWNCGDKCLLNDLYTWAVDNKSKFPAGTRNVGALATIEAVEGLSGLEISYYVLIDLKGFSSLIDALGGLTINVKSRTPIGGTTSPIIGYIEPGLQHLDGVHALWYARSRAGSDDFSRMARQRCLLQAMADQLNPVTVITKFQSIASAGEQVVQTDIPESDLGRFADLALKARGEKIQSINFVPPLIKPWSYDPAVITSTVQRALDGTPTAPSSTSGSASTSGGTAKPTSTSTAQSAVDDLSSVCGRT